MIEWVLYYAGGVLMVAILCLMGQPPVSHSSRSWTVLGNILAGLCWPLLLPLSFLALAGQIAYLTLKVVIWVSDKCGVSLIVKGKPLVLPVLAILALATAAHAGHCRVQVRQVIAHPVYAYPVQANVFYSVGEAARFESILDKKLAALMQQQPRTPGIAQPTPDATPNVSSPSMLAAKCAKCHSGTTPKGGLLLDGSAPLDCETVLQAMRAVRDGSMPPKSPLNADDAGVLFSELLDLSKPKE